MRQYWPATDPSFEPVLMWMPLTFASIGSLLLWLTPAAAPGFCLIMAAVPIVIAGVLGQYLGHTDHL